MSSLSHLSRAVDDLRAALRQKPTPRKPQPWDGVTKAALWKRLEEAEKRLERVAYEAEILAGRANNFGGELAPYNAPVMDCANERRRWLELRDDERVIRDIARGER